MPPRLHSGDATWAAPGETPLALEVVTRENWISALPRDLVEAIHAKMEWRALAAGETLAKAGAPARCMFQVIEGYVRVNGVHRNGDDAIVALYIPGNCLGEAAMISRRVHNHTAVAAVDGRVGVLHASDFWDLYATHSAIAEALCQKYIAALSRQMRLREARATLRLGQRIALMFDNLADHCVATAGQGLTLDLPLSQRDIAALFDVTRQGVQRALAELQALGAVRKSGGRWTITDRSSLRAYAQPHGLHQFA